MSATEQIIVTVPAVSTSWVVVTVPIKAKRYRIYRARALKVSGTFTTVALRVLETLDNNDYDIALEYSLTTSYIDYEEPGWLVQTKGGNTFIACKTNAGTNSIKVMLDIEPL